jgi:hypothetical protein
VEFILLWFEFVLQLMHLYTTAGRGHSRKNSRDFEEMDEDGDVSFFLM